MAMNTGPNQDQSDGNSGAIVPRPFKLALFDGSHNTRIGMTFSVTRDSVYSIALSGDGKLLAIGNDGGRLEVCSPAQVDQEHWLKPTPIPFRLSGPGRDGKPLGFTTLEPLFELCCGTRHIPGSSSLGVETATSTELNSTSRV